MKRPIWYVSIIEDGERVLLGNCRGTTRSDALADAQQRLPENYRNRELQLQLKACRGSASAAHPKGWA